MSFICIKNGDVYAPEHLGKKDILICNDRIIDISDSRDIGSFPYEVEIFDAEGNKVIPGLIDQHVHLTGGGGEKGFTSRVPEIKLSHITESGVTTVVGLLGTDSYTRDVETLLAKTKALNEEGITAYCLTGAYSIPSVTITGEVGKDITFIDEIIGVKVAISDHRCSNPTTEELIKLASETRLASLVSGKVGEVHMHTGSGKKGIGQIFEILENSDLPVKHFRPTHMRKSDEKNVVKLTSLGGYADYSSTENGADLKAQDIIDAIAAGADREHITISSDSNGSLPKWNEKRELIGITYAKMTSLFGQVKALVAKGMNFEDALPFITSNVAKALEIDDRKGSLKTDKDADVVILDREMNVDRVFAKGKLMVSGGKAVIKGFFEE